MNFLKILLIFNVFLIIFSSFKLKGHTGFQSLILNCLLLVSFYAVLITKGSSIYLVPFIGVILYGTKIGFQFTQWKELIPSLVVANISWLIYFAFYFILGDLQPRVTHEDYIIYSRIALYNDLLGTENTQGFYNLFAGNRPNDIYHFFELWFMSLASQLNGQGYLYNFLFLVLPLISFVSIAGIKELLASKGWLVPSLVFGGAMIISNPYDFLIHFLPYSLPELGFGSIFLYPKHIFVFPVIIFLVTSVNKGKVNYVLVCLFIFLYPLLAPVLLPSLVVFELIKSKFKPHKDLFFLVGFTLLTGFYMATHTTGEGIFSLKELWNLKTVLRILWIVLVSGLSFLIVFVVYVRKDSWQLILFMILTALMGMAWWFVLQININANQFYSLVFNSLLVLLTSISIWYLLSSKKYVFAIACIIIYLVPFYKSYKDIRFLNPPNELVKLVQKVPTSSKVLYLPPAHLIESVFQYNERQSMPDNSIFMNREDIHLISAITSIPPSFSLASPVRANMFLSYRKLSPYFNFCGEMNTNDLSCLTYFAKAHGIQFLLLDSSLKPDVSWAKMGVSGNLAIYQINPFLN